MIIITPLEQSQRKVGVEFVLAPSGSDPFANFLHRSLLQDHLGMHMLEHANVH